MGLKSLMQDLKSRAAVPSVPFEKSAEGTREPAWIGLVPPVPSVPLDFSDAHEIMQIGQLGEAVNEPATNDQPPKLPEPLTDPDVWRVLAHAYYEHHFKCPFCIAAGRGTGYGLRCGTGAALHSTYETAYDRSNTRS